MLTFAAPVFAVTACGGNGQISVKLQLLDTGPFKPGDTPQFRIMAINNGPGDASGVDLHVDLPTSLRYSSASITGVGNARTQALDARVGSTAPEWGFWDLAAPVSGSSLCGSCVQITFTASVQPDAHQADYMIAAHAQGDNTAGDVTSNEVQLSLTGAPKLDLSARVQAGVLGAGSSATYAITISNSGSAQATGVGLLVTLPAVLTFQKSVTPFAGNASRASPIDPVRGSIEVFYGGWTIPAASSGGPGFVTVVFIASVSPRPPSGTYPITVQTSDAGGDVVTLTGAAPVMVMGSNGAGPTVTAGPTSG
ncbi:MAG: hypothetical protein JOY80_01700 [Candidatus Dormibacteraeota bacterium]|nr:hypothetical protein [Candidatus Dormibacteraeota bacterium]